MSKSIKYITKDPEKRRFGQDVELAVNEKEFGMKFPHLSCCTQSVTFSVNHAL